MKINFFHLPLYIRKKLNENWILKKFLSFFFLLKCHLFLLPPCAKYKRMLWNASNFLIILYKFILTHFKLTFVCWKEPSYTIPTKINETESIFVQHSQLFPSLETYDSLMTTFIIYRRWVSFVFKLQRNEKTSEIHLLILYQTHRCNMCKKYAWYTNVLFLKSGLAD